MAERGWTAPHWPKEYGGGGLSTEEHQVLADEMGRINAAAPLSGHGLTMIGPAILEFGTHEQCLEHLPRIARGEIRWCQGYSEPGAGSDLASLQCRAEEDGDDYLVNGSKIWTSGADQADWIFALVRTDFSVKHDGISFLVLDMDTAGVTVSPSNSSAARRSSARPSSTTCGCPSATSSASPARVGRWASACCSTSAAPSADAATPGRR